MGVSGDLIWSGQRNMHLPKLVDKLIPSGPSARAFLEDASHRRIDARLGLKELFLFLIVRKLRPARVIETGVRVGWTTRALLSAMDANDRGKLVSIDLPTLGEGRLNADGAWDTAHVDRESDTGREVPEYLRSRWELRLGDARALLPAALSEAPIDMFFHDSDHSKSHMTWELGQAWSALRPGGILVADDTELHDGFATFCSSVGRTASPLVFGFGPRAMGAVRK